MIHRVMKFAAAGAVFAFAAGVPLAQASATGEPIARIRIEVFGGWSTLNLSAVRGEMQQSVTDSQNSLGYSSTTTTTDSIGGPAAGLGVGYRIVPSFGVGVRVANVGTETIVTTLKGASSTTADSIDERDTLKFNHMPLLLGVWYDVRGEEGFLFRAYAYAGQSRANGSLESKVHEILDFGSGSTAFDFELKVPLEGTAFYSELGAEIGYGFGKHFALTFGAGYHVGTVAVMKASEDVTGGGVVLVPKGTAMKDSNGKEIPFVLNGADARLGLRISF